MGDLQGVVKAVHLYSPGRLLHLQRRGETVALVDGTPDARYEFIAVRDSWLKDHYLKSCETDLDALMRQLGA